MIMITAIVQGRVTGIFETDDHARAKEALKEAMIKKGFTDVTIINAKSEVLPEDKGLDDLGFRRQI